MKQEISLKFFPPNLKIKMNFKLFTPGDQQSVCFTILMSLLKKKPSIAPNRDGGITMCDIHNAFVWRS